MRTGYMRALVDRGHTIKILSPMGKKSRATFKEVHEGIEQTGSWDTSWIKSLEYDPEGTAEDCELLIVESSACQWMFGCAVTKQPAIRRCADILNSYTGKVIVEQSDPDLPFPFGKLGGADKGWSDEENPYRLKEDKGHQHLEDYGWADPEEIWDNKEYYVCVRAIEKEAILHDGMANGKRFRYNDFVEEGKINIVPMPQAYDFEHHNVGVEGFNEDPKYDLVYAGYPRSDTRTNKFLFLVFNDG